MRFLSVTRIPLLLASLGCAALTEMDDGFGPAEMRIQGTVQYRAETGPSASHPGWLNTTVYIRATSVGGASVHYSGCPVTVRMYTDPARTGRPEWDALAVPNAACTLPLIVRQVERGEELTLRALTLPREVLGDSLAPGPYYVGAVVRPNGDSLVVEAGAVDLRP
jgi:hypothetical protein